MSRARHPSPVVVDPAFPIFLNELSALRRQQIENRFRRATEAHPLRRHDERPVHQDWMRADRVKQRVVGERRIAKAEIVKRRAFFAQDLAHRQAGASEQLRQQQPRRRAFEIFDNMRLYPGIADHRERIARGCACRIVIDDDIHHATSGRGFVAPSRAPISRNFAFNDNSSRLLIGRLVKAEIRFLIYRAANTNAASFSMSVPSTAAGSSMPQWAVIGWPGQTGQVSRAASSQRVKTKSITGAFGPENSSQLFERKPSVE